MKLSLNDWAIKAKGILEVAYSNDAVWTPDLQSFIDGCPAIPERDTYTVFLPGDSGPSEQTREPEARLTIRNWYPNRTEPITK